MKIAALKERANGELRTALTPEIVKKLVNKGYQLFVEKDIGLESNIENSDYVDAGAKVSSVPLEIISDADIILKVQPSPLIDKINEISLSKSGACIIGLLSPYSNSEYINSAAEKKLTTIAMELVPRTTKAQTMDVLSSQSNLAGYRAVLEAAYYFDRGFPMLMTAAGTIHPAKVLILGAGVAGLQAIATAKRLGASVSAYDVRAVAKEQVQSLGAKFLYPENAESHEGAGGYAKEVNKEFENIQEKFLEELVPKFDIVITTAQIPGKKAPELISHRTIEAMKRGSVVVDMATSTGGNVTDSVPDKIISKNGVKVIGWSNLAVKVAYDASRLYSNNLYNFLNYAVKDGKIDYKDELVEEMLVSLNGTIINKRFKV